MLDCVRVFFFSSRRRHTRCGRDWSSDVCSSDLEGAGACATIVQAPAPSRPIPKSFAGASLLALVLTWKRSEERRVGKSVDLGGGRIIKKKKCKEMCVW